MTQHELTFDGETYDPQKDCKRLTGQLKRVFDEMKAAHWYTLDELSLLCGGSTQSISARIRDNRKEKFGGHTVNRRRCNNSGLWEYQLIINKDLYNFDECE